MMSSFAWIYSQNSQTSFSWPTINPTQTKDDLLYSKYTFAPQCIGNMSIFFQLCLLVNKMCLFTLNHSNQSNKFSFASNTSNYIFYTLRENLRQSNHSNCFYLFLSQMCFTPSNISSQFFYTSRHSNNIFINSKHLEWFQTSLTTLKPKL
jgi:hypothetical protein